MNIDMIGPAIALGLGCLGSAIGCGIASMAFHGVISRVEEGHGKFMGMLAMPASQAIYGFVLMLLMAAKIQGKVISPAEGIGIALPVGLAILVSSVYQGMCAATGIQASAKQPAVAGKCFATLGIIESFSLFAFVFALLIMK